MLKIPSSMKLYFIFPVLMALYQFVEVGRPTTASCTIRACVFVLVLGVFSFVPYFVNIELSDDNHTLENIKREMIGIILYFIIAGICVFANPVKQMYNTELRLDNIVFFYSCDNHLLSEMFSYFDWFLVVEQIYFYFYGSFKRNKVVVYLQSYYLYIYK